MSSHSLNPAIRIAIYLVTVFVALLGNNAHAELFGLPNGRLVNQPVDTPLSVEIGYSTGDFLGADYDNPAIRINYAYNSNVQVFASLGQTSIGNSDDTAIGFGAFYKLGKVFEFSQGVALKGSLHRAELDRAVGGGIGADCGLPTTTIDPFTGGIILVPGICTPTLNPGVSVEDSITAISLELLVEGSPVRGVSIGTADATWYANISIQTFSGGSIDSEIGIGGGLVFPLAFGEAYIALDIIDELIPGVGLRYFVK